MSGFRNKSQKFKAKLKQCWNKKTHMTEEEAYDACALALYLYKSDQKPYKCPSCNFYHLTTVKGKGNGRVNR